MRQTDILNYLMNNSGQFIKVNQLADKFEVSEKTIANDMDKIVASLKEHDVDLMHFSKRGYCLRDSDCSKINIKALNTELSEKEKRYQSIISVLLSVNDYIKISFLADMFYLSESQIKKDLSIVKSKVSEYHLELKSSVKGIVLKGEERDKRRCIINEDITRTSFDELFDDKDKITEDIKTVLTDCIKKYDIIVSNHDCDNLLVHIYVAILRMKSGNLIKFIDELDGLGKIEKDAARSIYEQLSGKYGFDYNESEIDYLAFNLMGKRNYSINEERNEETYKLVLSILSDIEDKTGLDLSDEEFIRLLTLHFIPLRIRVLMNIPLQNPLLAEIKRKYPLAYEIAMVASLSYSKYTGAVLCEDEISYLALHFLMAITKKREKKKIVLVTNQRIGNVLLLKEILHKRFESDVASIVIINKSLYNEKEYRDDIVLSTDKSFVDNKEIIYINNLPNEQDYKNIQNAIKGNSQKNLKNIVTENAYFDIPSKMTKDKILGFLCDKSEKIFECNNLYEKVMEREKYGCTALDNKIAIPHPIGLTAEKTFVTVGVLNEDVDWDGKAIRLVFLISIKKGEKEKMSEIFDSISALVQCPELVEYFIHHKSYQNLIYVMNSAKELNYE